jgi:hypothetical protein
MKAIPSLFLFVLAFVCWGQNQQPKPQNASTAVARAFDTHNIVMFGEAHGCKQEYEWLRELVNTAEFADRVDDIVVELGNSLFQKSVDRYIAGENVPMEDVQPAWRDAIGTINAPSPVHESLFRAVREANLKRAGKHQMRIVLGGPPGDWSTIKSREELVPLLNGRDSWYTREVIQEVLAKQRRAFLIMGSLHFQRVQGPSPIEQQLLSARASTYLILFDTRVYDDPERRFRDWPVPAIVDLRGNWVGGIAALRETAPGVSPRLSDLADALLYVANARGALTVLSMPRAELDGTPYGIELDRRMMILRGQHLQIPEKPERPLGPR